MFSLSVPQNHLCFVVKKSLLNIICHPPGLTYFYKTNLVYTGIGDLKVYSLG